MRIREFIEQSDDEAGEFLERNAAKNKVKLTFWVSLIDNILSRSVRKGFLFSLCNPKYNLLDDKFRVFENQESEDDEHVDDDLTTFVILPFKNKISMWIEASIEKKMQYWDALLNHSKIDNPQYVNFSVDGSENSSMRKSICYKNEYEKSYDNLNQNLESEEQKENNSLRK